MKLINVRIPLFLAVALILGIFSCYEWYLGDIYFGLVVLFLLAALVVFTVIRRYGVRKVAVLMLVCALLGFCLARMSLLSMEKREAYGDNVTVTGRVCDLNRNTSENGIYYLEDCVLDSGEKISGRTQVKIYSTQFNTGDIVTVSGNLFSTYPVQSQIKSYLIRNNINYNLANAKLISQKSGAVKFDERARKYIYDVTHDYMIQNADVMYALLTGDRGAISDDVNYAFSRAGILHLLAVSGLHVGFIVAIICFALKRLRLHPLLECAIVIVPLTFYAYICAFTPSVVRAIVMVVCSYVARACYGRYDMLSALSWAALLILLVRPFYLFDVGFQLSFLSVYGIATMYSRIDRLLKARKMHKVLRYFVNSLILSLSCVAATLFTVAINFGEVPVFGVLLNLIVIPLVSVVFTLGIFGLIPWVFHYLLLAADYLLRAVVSLATAVANVSFASVVIVAVAAATVIVVVALFVFGGFVNIKRRGKLITYPILAILLVCSIVFAVVQMPARTEAYISVSEQSTAVAAVSGNGEATLVVDFNDATNFYNALSYLRRLRLTACTVYITDCSGAKADYVELLAKLPIDWVYIVGSDGSQVLEAEFAKRGISVAHQLPNSITGNYVKVQSHFDAKLVGVSISVNEIDICVVCGDNSVAAALLESGIVADVFVLPHADAIYFENNVTTVTPYQSDLLFNYGANKYGNFTIKQKGDRIILSFR